jgi:PEP-CTERM motif
MRKRILFVALVAVVSLCRSIPAKATDVFITFQDLTDAVTVTEPAGTFTCPVGTLEICLTTLAAPSAGARILSATGPGGAGIYPTFAHFTEPGTNSSTICAGGLVGPCISDGLLTAAVIGGTSVAFTFQSDPAAVTDPGLPACSTAVLVGGCQFIENGRPQEVGTITWSDGTVDHIQVSSDVPGTVPEPASLILLGSGLVMAGGFLRRRLL